MREILSLIPRQYRAGCIKVALLVPVKALLDLVGVAALLPVMMLVLTPEKLADSFVGHICDYFSITSPAGIASGIILCVIAVLVIKILLSLAIGNYQNRFLLKLYKNLSSRLFLSLYSRGLVYIKNQNSHKMTYNVIGVCHNFVTGHLGAILKFIGEVAFVAMMLAALLVYSPKATLVAICAFAPVVVLYIILIRKPLREMSKKENDARREQSRLINEAFRGYSEVQVNDAFGTIQQRFCESLDTISAFRIRSGIIQSIPSYMLELSVVAVVAMMLVISFFTSVKIDVLFLGVFSVALLKLMPAIKGIISCLSAISSTAYTKEIINEINTPLQFKLLNEEKVEPLQFKHSITVEKLSFAFPDESEPLFDNVSMEIPKGSRFGIKGRTGSGKTTLFNLLLGLYLPQNGCICIDDTPLTPENLPSWHRIVGYVPQDVFISDTTILQNVTMGIPEEQIDRKKAEKALAQASLKEFVDSLPEGMDTKIGEAGSRISGGQRQRLGIARALYKDATVFFFDEATSSLDSRTEMEVNAAIEDLSNNRKDITIIVISHRESTLSFCDTIYEI